MANIGIKIASCDNIGAAVKVLRGFSARSISEIKAAVENKDYVLEVESYDNEELSKVADCYKKLEAAGIEPELYEDGDRIDLQILMNLQQRNFEIENEIDAETELECDDFDPEELEEFSYLWTDELDQWVVIKDGYDYTIFNEKTQNVLVIEDEDLNDKVAAMMIMQGAEVRLGGDV